MDGMTRLIMGVQPRLHQTAIGREWAQQAISSPCNPQGLKAQILMVYDFVGMKACQLMYKYLGTGPLVLVLPNVMEDTRRFKAAYDNLKAARGEVDFPYTRLMGMGEELNHAKYPDLYYCAIGYYKYIGSIGGKDGKFIKSNLETKTEAAVLDKYYKISASGSGFKTIISSGFSDNVQSKGKLLVKGHHVINVKEIILGNKSQINGHVIRQASVTLNPYLVKLVVDGSNRDVEMVRLGKMR
ncbi:hypothetical protein QTP88_029728 [Uroleucon formosanum]